MTNKFLQSILLLLNITYSLKINYYFERQSTLKGDDFLHLYIDQNNLSNRKIVYKIPKNFRNKEVFKIKICKKDTISYVQNQINENSEVNLEEFYESNCLEDEYNTINVIEFEERILLKQVPIYNLYKICSFGYAYAEAEKAFLSLSFNSLLFDDRIQKEEIFFKDIGKIQEIFEESHSKYYRKELNDNTDYHCKLDFLDELEDFTYEKFGDIFFHERNQLDSIFIIEYDFDLNFNPILPEKLDFQIDEMRPENKISLRDKVLKSMEKDYIFTSKSFEQSNLIISFPNNSDSENDKFEKLDKDFIYNRVENNIRTEDLDYSKKKKK